MVVDNATVLAQPKATKALLLQPQALKVAILLHDFSACRGGSAATGGPSISEADLRRVLFEKAWPSGLTMEAQFRTCTYNRLTFQDAPPVYVVRVPLERCNGVPGQYVFNDCPGTGQTSTLWDAVEAIAVAQFSQLKTYQYRWHVLSKSMASGPNCNSYAGVATLGCGASSPDGRKDVCRMLINPAAMSQTFVWLHEAGHNLGLDHAGRSKDLDASGVMRTYGDMSCLQGLWGQAPYERCFNLPHAVQLGAALPTVWQESEVLGRIRSFAVAPANQQRNNGLQVVTSRRAQNGQFTSVYLSYRRNAAYYPLTARGGDLSLDTGFDSLLVHLFPDPRNGFSHLSTLEGRLAVGARFEEPETGMVIRLLAVTASSASFTICQRTRNSAGQVNRAQVCNSGVDDDCDGSTTNGCPLVAGAPRCGDGVCTPNLESYATCWNDCKKGMDSMCKYKSQCKEGLFCQIPPGGSRGRCKPVFPPSPILV